MFNYKKEMKSVFIKNKDLIFLKNAIIGYICMCGSRIRFLQIYNNNCFELEHVKKQEEIAINNLEIINKLIEDFESVTFIKDEI